MKSNRQVLGEVVGTGAEALSGGIIKGTKVGLAKTGETALSTQLAKKNFSKIFEWKIETNRQRNLIRRGFNTPNRLHS